MRFDRTFPRDRMSIPVGIGRRSLLPRSEVPTAGMRSRPVVRQDGQCGINRLLSAFRKSGQSSFSLPLLFSPTVRARIAGSLHLRTVPYPVWNGALRVRFFSPSRACSHLDSIRPRFITPTRFSVLLIQKYATPPLLVKRRYRSRKSAVQIVDHPNRAFRVIVVAKLCRSKAGAALFAREQGPMDRPFAL